MTKTNKGARDNMNTPKPRNSGCGNMVQPMIRPWYFEIRKFINYSHVMIRLLPYRPTVVTAQQGTDTQLKRQMKTFLFGH